MNTVSRYLVAFTALGAGAWLVYKNEAKYGSGLIGFAGLLIDYSEVGAFIVNTVRAWRGQ